MKRTASRKQFYLDAGFLPFEAEAYKELPPPHKLPPYLKQMVAARRKAFNDAKRHNVSHADYVKRITDIYITSGYTRVTEGGHRKLDAWKHIRDVQEKNAPKFPDYESPSGKKRTGLKDFNRGALEPRKPRIVQPHRKPGQGRNFSQIPHWSDKR